MEKKFIKYKQQQVNLARLYRVSTCNMFDNSDVQDGTLVIGQYGDGKYLAMGYLRKMTRDSDTGKVLYEITSAIEDECDSIVQNPYKVSTVELPFFAAKTIDSDIPVVGRVCKCNGELAIMDTGFGRTTVNVNSVFELVPYFKEDK